MMIGFATRLKRMGGFNIMAGVRITWRNMWYMLLAIWFLLIAWLMWKITVFGGYMLYYLCVFAALCFKRPFAWHKATTPKNKAITMYAIAGLFAVSAMPPFVAGDALVAVVTLLCGAGIAFYGFRQGRGAMPPASEDEGAKEERLQ